MKHMNRNDHPEQAQDFSVHCIKWQSRNKIVKNSLRCLNQTIPTKPNVNIRYKFNNLMMDALGISTRKT